MIEVIASGSRIKCSKRQDVSRILGIINTTNTETSLTILLTVVIGLSDLTL